MDHDSIFVWFTKCLTDLEPETQKDLFNQKLLNLPPSTTTQKSFSCIKAYFESVNVFDQRLKKSPSPTYVVERTELVGMSYFWDILTESPKEDIANLAIDMVLNMSYLHVTSRLKKEPGCLHEKFIKNCYTRLETICQKSENNHDAVLEGAVKVFHYLKAFQDIFSGCELETSCSEVKSVSSPISSAVASTTKTLTSISVSKVMGLSLPNKYQLLKYV